MREFENCWLLAARAFLLAYFCSPRCLCYFLLLLLIIINQIWEG